MQPNRRKTRFIPNSVQGAMLWRAVFHWVLMIGATLTILVSWQFLIGDPHQTLSGCFDETWQRFGPCIVVFLMVLPIVVRDTVKFTNKLAGPLFRLRHALERLANDERVSPIRFRKGDMCQDLAEQFNTVLLRIQRDEEESRTKTEPAEKTECETAGRPA
jgi:hypothetical protein